MSTTNVTTSSTTPMPPPVIIDEGMSGGTAFCLFFIFICLVYFGGGIVVKKFLRGAEGPEMIPHFEFWNDLPNLIRDGVVFTLRGCRHETSYETL